jgi:NADPH-dependent curcumin reductase CurA
MGATESLLGLDAWQALEAANPVLAQMEPDLEALLVNRARMEGIVVFDYAERYHLGVAALAGWLKEGSFKSREDVVEGLEKFPEALLMLFEGKNFGKLVLKVADA